MTDRGPINHQSRYAVLNFLSTRIMPGLCIKGWSRWGWLSWKDCIPLQATPKTAWNAPAGSQTGMQAFDDSQSHLALAGWKLGPGWGQGLASYTLHNHVQLLKIKPNFSCLFKQVSWLCQAIVWAALNQITLFLLQILSQEVSFMTKQVCESARAGGSPYRLKLLETWPDLVSNYKFADFDKLWLEVQATTSSQTFAKV